MKFLFRSGRRVPKPVRPNRDAIIAVMVPYVAEALERRFLFTAISSGQTVTATLAVAGEQDSYTVAAADGETVRLSLGTPAGGNASLYPYLFVYGPGGGAAVATDYDATGNTSTRSARVAFTVPAGGGGTYTVVAQSLYSTGVGGAYALEMAKAPGPHAADADGDGGAIASGQTKAGTLNRAGDLDVFTLSAADGGTVRLSLGTPAGGNADLYPNLLVYGPGGGAAVATDYDVNGDASTRSARVAFTVPAGGGGTFTVVAQSLYSTGVGGAYALEMAAAPAAQAADADGDGGPIASGQTKAGTLNRAGDLDVFTLSAADGETVRLSLGTPAGGNANLYPNLLVYGPNGGADVATDYDVTGNTSTRSARVAFTVPAGGGGTFTVVAQGFNSTIVGGAYALEMAAAPAAQAADADGDGGPIASGQTKAGTLNRAGDLDVFTLSAADGETVRLSLGTPAGGNANLYPNLLVYGPNGGADVATDYDVTGNTSTRSARVAFTVPAGGGGTFTVVAQGYYSTGVGGAYALEMAKAPGPHAADADGDGGPIASGQTKAGTLSRAGDLDIFTAAAAAGEMFTLTLTNIEATGGVHPWLRVFGPTGAKVGESSASPATVTYTVPAGGTGTYTVLAEDSTATGTGRYMLDLAFAAPKLLGTTIDDGTIQRSMVRKVTFAFGQPVTLDGTAFSLARLNTGGSGLNDGSAPTNATAAVGTPTTADGGYTWVYTFAASAFTENNRSLKDGIYRLTLNALGVTGKGGPLAADASLTFHRKFGDQEGNKQVNNADYVRFRSAFGSATGAAAFNPIFDFDGNGVINNADYVQFRSRFGTSFTYG